VSTTTCAAGGLPFGPKGQKGNRAFDALLLNLQPGARHPVCMAGIVCFAGTGLMTLSSLSSKDQMMPFFQILARSAIKKSG
jgi:hypothetical protein